MLLKKTRKAWRSRHTSPQYPDENGRLPSVLQSLM
jgi:hypothetical protein